MSTSFALPVVSSEGSLTRYLEEIKRFPMLEAEEEYMLAKRLAESGDVEAAHRLVTSHLKLVAKIAMGFRGYGLPVMELISEGNIGLMQAVKRFDVERGFRLSTYAIWWIKAAMQEYVLRSWSLVKIGTTAAQKKLFFNLRRIKNRLNALENKSLSQEDIRAIAGELDVSEQEVIDMDMRLSYADNSLNNLVGRTDDSDGTELIDLIPETSANQEILLAEREDMGIKRASLAKAIATLNPREQDILEARRLQEDPATLEDLAQKYSISRERVRQIEARAMEKLQLLMLPKPAAA